MKASRLTRAFALLSLVTFAACTEPQTPPKEPQTTATASASVGTPPSDGKTPAKTPTPAEAFTAECKGHLQAVKDDLAKILAVKEARTVANTLETYNDLLTHLQDAQQKASLLAEVHPDKDYRAAAEKCVEDASSVNSELNLNPDLYKAVSTVDVTKADADTKRFVERTIRDFKRSGVDKDEATRKRLKELNDKMTSIGLEFDKNIREDVRKVAFTPAELKGLPDDYLKAHAPDKDGKVTITTDYPDYLPFARYVENLEARKKLYLEYMNRGWPANDAVLKKLLGLRKEYAGILGYKSWADYITEDKMIKSAKNAQEFIDKIAKASDKRGKRDYAELLKRKQKDDKAAKEVPDWEKSLYSEKVKKDAYSFDSQSVRPYFEFKATRDGLLAITSKLYGIEYKKVEGAATWHPDVDVYDVIQGGKQVGRIYLDLHPREGKYKHAAQFGLVPGVAGKQIPEAVLVCNFADPKNGEALMDHDDVETMFHEFGHLLHAVLGGQQKWVYFSGVATEWDFVEAPSQMFEEWAWDPAVLRTFAKHVKTGEPIPEDLVKKMRRANEFGKGSDARQQMLYAALALRLHEEGDPDKLDTTKVLSETYAKYGMFKYVDGTHLQANFGHLNGYSAMYYTYMWSLVIAKDLLGEFKKNGLMDTKTAQRYRDAILVPGGTKDAADLVKTFLGRPYDFKAYEAWLNAE